MQHLTPGCLHSESQGTKQTSGAGSMDSKHKFEKLKYLLMEAEIMGHKNCLTFFEVYENVQNQKKKKKRNHLA